MPDPFIGLPLLIGTVVTAAVVKGVSGHNKKKARERYYNELTEEVRQQGARARATMAQGGQNRVIASQVAARAFGNARVPAANRIALLRALAAEVNRENAVLEAIARDGGSRPTGHGSLEQRLNAVVQRYTR